VGFAEGRTEGRTEGRPEGRPGGPEEAGGRPPTGSGVAGRPPAGGPGAASANAATDAVVAGASPAVWCSGISKRYGRRPALTSVSLTIARGEVVGLLGPNGAGKTSLIKIMLGLVAADAGDVMLLGHKGSDPASRARVGYLPELFRYQPWLTAAEVLTFHTRLGRLRASAADRAELLRLVGLGERAGDRVGRFSKGMQQRLGLAVALLGEPELVVLDEPTSALDPVGRADVRKIVLALRERGTAVLLNSHLIGEVERVCDRVVILDHGRVAASGTLDELLGESEVRLRLQDVDDAARRVLDGFGAPGGASWAGEWVTVRGVDGAAVPDLVAGLVRAGARVHAVEPGRQTLEERLLDVLRTGDGHGAAGSGAAGSGAAGNGAGAVREGGPA
jgi:ABC-2 type transport system ATP-binding protein